MSTKNSKGYGIYAINGTDFPMPITSWEEQPIGVGMNGISVLNSYRLHNWQWDQLESEYAILLYSIYNTQQTNNTAITSLETDFYDASGATEKYGTETYTDVLIKEISARVRGMPNYDDVSVVFEVYVP